MNPTSRRALLRAAAVAPVALVATSARAVVASDSSTKHPPVVSPDLERLIADHTVGDAALCRFYDEVFNPACESQQERYNAVPHAVQRITPMPGDDREREWTTANRFDVACVSGIVKLSRDRVCPHKEPARSLRRREARSFWAAHLRRERELERIKADPVVVAAGAEEERLDAIQRAIEEAILKFPCRSLADLHAKAAFFARRDLIAEDFTSHIAADAARLIGKEA